MKETNTLPLYSEDKYFKKVYYYTKDGVIYLHHVHIEKNFTKFICEFFREDVSEDASIINEFASLVVSHNLSNPNRRDSQTELSFDSVGVDMFPKVISYPKSHKAPHAIIKFGKTKGGEYCQFY